MTEVGRFAKFLAKREYRRVSRNLKGWNENTGRKWSERAERKAGEEAARKDRQQRQPAQERPVPDPSTKARRPPRDWTRLTASILASAALFGAIGIAIYFASRGGEVEETAIEPVLTCLNCRSASVDRIIDGDTLDTSIGRIRIYGADTPERGQPCFDEATDEMRRLASNRVRLEAGPRAEDPFGRNLYYLYTDSGDSIDELLITTGFAEAWTEDGQHRDHLVATEATARQNSTGCLWN